MIEFPTVAPSPAKSKSAYAHIGMLAVLLGLTAAASVLWSNCKVLWLDEIMVKWTASVSSARQVADIQLHYPISLDPLMYHEIEHMAATLFGANALGLRTPSILGFLLMQICLFVFACRIGGTNAGLMAAAFPVFTGAFFYAPESRPYALMLGFYALAMVGWQGAAIHTSNRAVALLELTCGLILAMNTHYYGVLILIPIFTAELARTFLMRRVDVAVWGAIGAGACGFALVLPTMHAARQFLPHLWDRAGATLDHVFRTYFISLPHFVVDHQSSTLLKAVFGVSCALLFLACLVKIRTWFKPEMVSTAVLVGTLMAFPIFGACAALKTHVFEPRYLLGTVLGVSCFVAISLAGWIPEQRSTTLTIVLALGVVLSGVTHALEEKKHSDDVLKSLAVAADIKEQLLDNAKFLNIANMGLFAQMSEYEPDPDVRSRLAFVYSEGEEVRYAQMDTASLTAVHLKRFSSLRTEAYESMVEEGGDHLYLLRPTIDPPPGTFGSDWVTLASEAMGVSMRPVDRIAGGEAVILPFPSQRK